MNLLTKLCNNVYQHFKAEITDYSFKRVYLYEVRCFGQGNKLCLTFHYTNNTFPLRDCEATYCVFFVSTLLFELEKSD